ncbi:MAG: hypothetical protein HGA67_00765 [Candidatus Yonathbacteria bacterium]|nr:hypothetical protein [Candidatus Yonathbacteria bacterium]
MNGTVVVLVGCDADPRAVEFASSFPGAKIITSKDITMAKNNVDHVVVLGSSENEERLREIAAEIGKNPNVIQVSVYALPTSKNERRPVSFLHAIFSGLVPRKNSVRHGQLVCSTIREY